MKIAGMNIDQKTMIIGGIALIGLYILVTRTNALKVAQSAGAAVGSAVVGAASGVIGGAVTGAGSIVGIPNTDLQKCTLAKNAGNTWDASLYCTAPDFISWMAQGRPSVPISQPEKTVGSGSTQG